jgi:hypothetical protein
MTSWSAHVHARRPVVLVAERFSLGAMVFGPLWLLWSGAWIPAVLLACAWVAAVALVPAEGLGPVLLGLAWFTGLTGRDLRRWSLARRGWREAHVVVAADEEAAMARLLQFQPALGALDLPAHDLPAHGERARAGAAAAP